MHVDEQRIKMDLLPSCFIRQMRASSMRFINHIMIIFLIYILENIRRIPSIFNNTINGHILPYALQAIGSTKAKEQEKILHVHAKLPRNWIFRIHVAKSIQLEFSGYTLQNKFSLVSLNFYLITPVKNWITVEYEAHNINKYTNREAEAYISWRIWIYVSIDIHPVLNWIYDNKISDTTLNLQTGSH